MIVYLSVMFLCCILLYVMRNNSNKMAALAIVFGIIWLMLALQEGWGGDYESYVYHFNEIKGLGFKDVLIDESYHGEVGYKIILWLMPTFHTWFIVNMGVWCFAMAFFFYHFVPQKTWYMAILLFFLDKPVLMGMVGSFCRMAIASSFLVFAYYLVCKDKFKWLALVLLLCGFLFHKSIILMAPFVFIKPKRGNLNNYVVIALFVVLYLFSWIMPSSWTNIVEGIVQNFDTIKEYEYYLEYNQVADASRGLSLIIFFYWIYLLALHSKKNNYENGEYFVIKLALFRIVFDILPAVGLSSRIFYFIDVYFFAGLLCVFNRLPKNDPNRWGIVVSLLLMIWYMGFHQYVRTPFYLEHWASYNYIF